MNRPMLSLMFAAALWGSADQAAAQFTPFNPSSALNNVGYSINNYLYNRPTVSPYLNLARSDSGGFMPNYHTLVRPALNRRQEQARQSAHLARLDQQVQQVREDTQRAVQNGEFITGHPTRFMTYLHYYTFPLPAR